MFRRLVLPIMLLAVIAGCRREDPRLAHMTIGITKDSAITVMGGERPSRVDPYLVSGQYIEAMLFIRPGTQPVGVDTLPDRERTPVVVINGQVTGWGWNHWDSVAAANNIPPSPKE